MHKISQPKLSPGNHIYLYRLLRDAIGAGKQTLMPNVEEALEAEQLGARDLGFESTRDLLEALDDFIKLTVFKGGTHLRHGDRPAARMGPSARRAGQAAHGRKREIVEAQEGRQVPQAREAQAREARAAHR